MARDGSEVRLDALTAEQVGAVAEKVLGRALPAGVAAALYERTGGNPLFVVECASACRGTRLDAATLTALPDTVRTLVVDRVARLPAETRSALDAGAIFGRSFSASLVARVRHWLPARVVDAILPALRAGVVDELRPAEFSFTHILVRDAIEAALSRGVRLELHALAADALRDAGAGVDVLVEQARHRLLSGRDPEGAIAFAEDAASLLEQQGAHDRAYQMLSRVEEARRSAGTPAAPAARLRIATIALAAGRHRNARALCDEVASLARASRDGELLALAALTAGSELVPGAVDPALVDLLTEALPATGVNEALRSRVEARLAAALQPAPDPEGPIRMARDAIARARSTGDPELLLDALHIAGAALVELGPDDEQLALAEELRDRALAASDHTKTLRAYTRLIVQQMSRGLEWERTVDRALDLSLAVGHPRHRWPALLLASSRAIARGDFAASDRYVVEVQQLASLTDDPALSNSLEAHVASRARLLHRDEEALLLLRGLEGNMTNVPFAPVIAATLRAGTLARFEDAEAVRAELGTIRDVARFLESFRFFGALVAEVYALVGTEEERRRMRAIFEPREERNLTGGHIPFTYEGPVRRVLALLDASLGDHASAERRLRPALATASERGHRAWVAQLEYDLGRVLSGAGRSTEARECFGRAARLAEELGMPGLVTRAQSKAGAPPPSRAPGNSLSLGREGDAWRIVFAGRSVVVRDSRGMQLLARLVGRPGEELHVLALAADEAGTLVEAEAGGAIDARALRAYRTRLRELDVDIAEAEEAANLGLLEALQREKQALEAELRRSVGLGGKIRGAASASERARVNVQRRLKDAFARISEASPEAARYLEKAVRTGTYCSFRP
jgi:tetratricopeptide (TPR) repeat protein